MKLLEQYIHAIGKHLPYNSRNEIKLELRSLLLDEIEGKYGDQPSKADIEEVIQNYGAPRVVASRYKSDHLVIGSGYTDLFFMIMKLILLAMTIAFTVTFIVEFISTNPSTSSFFIGLAMIPGNVLSASLSALGVLTLVFMLITKYNQDESINLDDDWTPAELKDIKVGPEEESRIGSAFAIFFSLLFIIIINSAPQLISIAESSFELSGIKLGHHIDIEVFKSYLLLLNIVWLAEIVYHVVNMIAGNSIGLAFYRVCSEVASAIVMIILVSSTTLYIVYTSTYLGFRGIFMFVAFISVVEAISRIFKFIKYYVLSL